MIQIIDFQDTGKTKKLLIEAEKSGGLVVCKHPIRMKEKSEAYGIRGLNFISYEDFIDYPTNLLESPIYIDELENFFLICYPTLNGYTLTKN